MAYLAQLKPNVYTSKHKYTEDAARINQIKNLADTNSYIENSDAYDVLKKTLPLFKTGIKPLDGKNNKEQINKTVGEISALLNSDKGAINLESTLEVLMKNAGDNLPYLMKVLQNTIDPTILNNKAKSLGNKGYLGLMDTLAKGIIVAKKLKTGKIKPGEVRENLDTFLPDDETSEAYKKTRAYISEHLEEDAAEIAEDDTYNFFGK